jgi:hypothetical protein
MGLETIRHSGLSVSCNAKRRLMTTGGALLMSVAAVISATGATTHAASTPSLSLNNSSAASTTSQKGFVSLSGNGTGGTYTMSSGTSGAAVTSGTWSGYLGGAYWFNHKGNTYTAVGSCGAANYVILQYYLDIPGAFSLSTLTVYYDETKSQGTYALSSSLGNFMTTKPSSSVQVAVNC